MDEQRRYKKPKKICRICGAESNSFNFGVVTCESCKSFFRRHSRKSLEEFQCVQMDGCEITSESRNKCPKCRLQKCFQAGMKMNYAVIEKQKIEKEANHHMYSYASLCTSEESNSSSSDDQPSSVREDEMSNNNCPNEISSQSPFTVISKDIKNGEMLVTLRMSKDAILEHLITQITGNSNAKFNIQLEEPMADLDTAHQESTLASEIGNMLQSETINQHQVADYNSTFDIHSMDSTLGNTGNINFSNTNEHPQLPVLSCEIVSLKLKAIRLEELRVANRVWNRVPKQIQHLTGLFASNITYENFFNLMYHSYTYLIKQHIKLSAFKNINKEDQVSLLKDHLPELFMIRMICRYSSSNDIFDQQRSSAPSFVALDIFRRVKTGVYSEAIMLKESFPAKCSNDETLMLLLSVSALFDPSGIKLVDKKVVEYQHQSYIQLLKGYLENFYSSEVAPTMYKRFLSWLDDVTGFVKNCYPKVIFDLHPRNYEILMMDIFDFQ